MSKVKSWIQQLDPFTQIVLLINTLVYVWSMVQNHMSALTGLSKNQMLHTFGMTGDNGLIPIITSMFSHYSLGHFVMNMLTLTLLSTIVTKYFSIPSYMMAYFASGITGNLMTKWFDPHVVTLGASGAIYGVMGMLFVAVIAGNFMTQLSDLQPLTTMVLITIGVNIFYTLYNEHLNAFAHISGLFVGMVCMGVILWRLKKQS